MSWLDLVFKASEIAFYLAVIIYIIRRWKD